MDQPYSRMADMLLDTQYYNVSDPSPYDDTGWTMGAMRNVKTVRVVDKSVLNVEAKLLTEDAKVTGQQVCEIAGVAVHARIRIGEGASGLRGTEIDVGGIASIVENREPRSTPA